MRRLILALSVLALASCTTGPGLPDASLSDSGGPDAGFDASRPDTGPAIDAGPRLDDVLIYAHSRDTLYTFSPFTNTVVEIGPFLTAAGDAAPNMLDLAVDSVGEVYTSSTDTLFTVDPATARVTPVGTFGLGGEQLFALSFLTPTESPDGTEMLIGATNEGAYYRVNRVTAATSLLGRYPDGWASSGDIVSVEGLGTFATLKRADFGSDVLARIIFSSDGSSLVTVVGATRGGGVDYTQIFGLGYWGREVYGFTNAGELIRINRDTGASEVVMSMTGASNFWGAGVTTQAPVLF